MESDEVIRRVIGLVVGKSFRRLTEYTQQFSLHYMWWNTDYTSCFSLAEKEQHGAFEMWGSSANVEAAAQELKWLIWEKMIECGVYDTIEYSAEWGPIENSYQSPGWDGSELVYNEPTLGYNEPTWNALVQRAVESYQAVTARPVPTLEVAPPPLAAAAPFPPLATAAAAAAAARATSLPPQRVCDRSWTGSRCPWSISPIDVGEQIRAIFESPKSPSCSAEEGAALLYNWSATVSSDTDDSGPSETDDSGPSETEADEWLQSYISAGACTGDDDSGPTVSSEYLPDAMCCGEVVTWLCSNCSTSNGDDQDVCSGCSYIHVSLPLSD